MPVPTVDNFSASELSRSSAWFPFVGLAIGVIVALTVWVISHRGAYLGAAVGLVTWVWITGALHLDGLADLSDALAAAHRDSQKFLVVLADPRLGAFGAISIVLVAILKVVALGQLSAAALLALPLVPAWARLGPLAWGRWLKPLKAGHGERFACHLNSGWIVFWSAVLLAGSAVLAPVLCVAPLLIAGWGLWLNWRLGGTTGDCLGAGVEITETALLYCLALFGTTSGAWGALQ